jgi:hypothetical protein
MSNIELPGLSKETLPKGCQESRHCEKDKNAFGIAEIAFQQANIPLIDKLESFPRFATKRSLARFIVKEKLFKKILNINGIIIECGVFNGSGLFTWAQLSNIYEPTNYNRKIVGFDTFEGFPNVNNEADNLGVLKSKKGDLKGSSLEEIQISIEKYQKERHLSHLKNIHLFKGDFNNTAPEFVKNNPQIIISLLYLDFDLYEPTKKALELFLPKMPRGSIIVFDELNCESFPGETRALQEVIGIQKYEIKRFPIDPWISYLQL